MSTRSEPYTEHAPSPPGRRRHSRAAYRCLAEIASEATSDSEFWLRGFREAIREAPIIYSQIALTAGATVIEDYWHQGPLDPSFWKPTVSAIIDETIGEAHEKVRVFRARREDRRIAIFCTVLTDGNELPIGALCIVREVSAADDLQDRLTDLSALSDYMSFLAAGIKRSSRAARSPGTAYSGASLEKMTGVESLHQLAFAVTNNLRNRLGCEQVALARVKAGRAQILALSGFDELKERHPGVRVIKAAMEEAIDRRQVTVCQRVSDWDSDSAPPEYRLHRQWHEVAARAAVASIPFMREDECIAVLSIRARPGQSWDPEVLEKVEEQVYPYAAGLQLVAAANRSVIEHTWASMLLTLRSLTARGSVGRRATMAIVLALAAWVAFGTAPYRITVPCVVRPTVAQRYFAPYAGVVADVFVESGDQVVRGQPLFQMDTQDVQLEIEYVDAQSRIAEIALATAEQSNDVVNAELERGRLGLYGVQRAIAQRQLERGMIVAAHDGLVTVGDPNLLVGQMVAIGDPIVEVVPTSEWMVQLEVPEDEMSPIQAGLSGHIALNARPEDVQQIRVDRVLPQSHQRNQQNVFVAEASIDTDSGWLRPGMEGTARIEIEKKPVWWIASHRFVRAVRQMLWI